MRAIRAIVALAVLATSIVAVHHFCWLRFQCETDKFTLQRRLEDAMRAEASDTKEVGRDAAPLLLECVEYDRGDYEARFLLGIAEEAAGRNDRAVSLYEETLAIIERPEIHARIAALQLRTGQFEEARRHLLRAAFFNAAFVRTVSGSLRDEVLEAALARHRRFREKSGRPPRGRR